jgi:hypothetical protein
MYVDQFWNPLVFRGRFESREGKTAQNWTSCNCHGKYCPSAVVADDAPVTLQVEHPVRHSREW